MKSYIDYVLVDEKPKTDVFTVFSRSSLEELGTIKWYAPWRQYCFFPESGTVFNVSCLNDVNHFIEQLRQQRNSPSNSG